MADAFATKVAVTSSVIVAISEVYVVVDTLYLIVSPTFSSDKNLELAPIKDLVPFAVVILPDSCGLSNSRVSPSS